MKITELKINPNNPQKFDDLSKLQKSLKEFPKMLELRPLIYDPETMYVLGGNKRLICLQNLGFKELKKEWVKSAEDLTEEEKERFIIADNVGFGEWDFELLEDNWNIEDLEDWGLEMGDFENNNENKSDFEKELEKYDDSNCKMPIVPDFFEKHECFIIPIDNEIDENFVRDVFGLNQIFKSKSKDKKERKTNVIAIENLRKIINER